MCLRKGQTDLSLLSGRGGSGKSLSLFSVSVDWLWLLVGPRFFLPSNSENVRKHIENSKRHTNLALLWVLQLAQCLSDWLPKWSSSSSVTKQAKRCELYSSCVCGLKKIQLGPSCLVPCNCSTTAYCWLYGCYKLITSAQWWPQVMLDLVKVWCSKEIRSLTGKLKSRISITTATVELLLLNWEYETHRKLTDLSRFHSQK